MYASSHDFFPWYTHWATHQPNDRALVTPSATLSYESLFDRVTDASSRFKLAGIGPGARIILDTAPMSEDWVIGLLSALHRGAQVIMPDTAWLREERKVCLASLRPSHILGIANELDPLERETESEATNEAPGVWLFTSGTTGSPQPHFRSVALLASMVYRVRERLPEDVIETRPASLALAPLYHGYGLVNTLLLTHALGGSVVLDDGHDAHKIAGSLLRHNIQVLFGWPSHFKLLAKDSVSNALKAAPLRWAVSSSSKLDPVVASRFSDASECPLRQQYGTTETGPLCLDDEMATAGDTRCIGRPLSGIEIQVLGSQDEILPKGEEGMLAVRFSEGVPRPPQLANGEFWRVGDLGKIDSQGRVFLLGRATPFTDERKEV